VIGWGAGATAAAAALYPVERIECVEIEPATYEAAPLFEELSGRVRRDPRFRIVFRDGRNHLLRGRDPLDVIVSEPSNPWISGVANLFTREFYDAARQRLAPGGVFGQWFHYYNMEPTDVNVELATFAASFPYVSVWLVPPLPAAAGGTLSADLLLVGSAEPQRLEWTRLVRTFRDTPVGADLRATGAVRDELALAAAYAFGRDELRRLVGAGASGGGPPLNTDDFPWIEFRAPRRNVVPPAEVAQRARELYVLLGEAGDGGVPPLAGHPGLGIQGRHAAELRVDLAERWTEAGLPRRARRALDAAVAAGPDDERAWEALGGAALDARDWPRAEEAHRALLRLRPRDVDATLRLAAVLARQGKWDESQAALRRARELDPRAPVDPRLAAYVEARARPGGGEP
jgi:spermidine synthase